MLLDGDVVLGPRCVARLAEALARRPEFAALGADTSAEMDGSWEHWDYPQHVRLTAVLFRRERLEPLTFRWEPAQWDSQCCCDALRRAGYAIGYLAGAEAWHRPSRGAATALGAEGSRHRADRLEGPRASETTPSVAWSDLPGRILAAFDRRHLRLFIRRFL